MSFNNSPNRHSIASRGADTIKLLNIQFPINKMSFNTATNTSYNIKRDYTPQFPPYFFNSIIPSYSAFLKISYNTPIDIKKARYEEFIRTLQHYVLTNKLTDKERYAILFLLLGSANKIKEVAKSYSNVWIDMALLFQYLNLPEKYIKTYINSLFAGNYRIYQQNLAKYKSIYNMLKSYLLPSDVINRIHKTDKLYKEPIGPSPIERGFNTHIMLYLLYKLATKQYLTDNELALLHFFKNSIYTLIGYSFNSNQSAIKDVHNWYPDLVFLQEAFGLIDKIAEKVDFSNPSSHEIISEYDIKFVLPLYNYKKYYIDHYYYLNAPNMLLPSLEMLLLIKPYLKSKINKEIFKKYMIAIELSNASSTHKPESFSSKVPYYYLLAYNQSDIEKLLNYFGIARRSNEEINDFINFLLAYQKSLIDHIKPYYYVDYEKVKEITLRNIYESYSEYSIDKKKISYYYKQLSKMPLQNIIKAYISKFIKDVEIPISKNDINQNHSKNVNYPKITEYLKYILRLINQQRFNFYINYTTSLPYSNPNPYITILSPYLSIPALARMLMKHVNKNHYTYIFDKSPLTETEVEDFDYWYEEYSKYYSEIKDIYDLSVYYEYIKSIY